MRWMYLVLCVLAVISALGVNLEVAKIPSVGQTQTQEPSKELVLEKK